LQTRRIPRPTAFLSRRVLALLTLSVLSASVATSASRAATAASSDSTTRAHRIKENAVVDTLPAVEVTDTFDHSVRRVLSSSQGAVTSAELAARPIYRPGEMLETVPGVVISQHSGEGKANQYYLRGFNLDHGTDMATFVAGIPVNMPSHAHGQGYSDLNFMIPELVTGVEYRKGTYFAAEGDFGTAGAAHIAYANRLDRSIAQFGADEDGYRRALVAGSTDWNRGDLLYALEVFHNDGPWVDPDDYRKLNGVLRWGRSWSDGGFRVTGMGYGGKWNSTDQVAERAVSEGLISRFGAIDPTDGGRSQRYSLSGDWQRFSPTSLTQAAAYVIDYRLNLFSDFTYFLDDSVNGDQFEQQDRRVVSGLRMSHAWRASWMGREIENVAGLQARRDDIGSVGLFHTRDQVRLSTTRDDQVAQTSVSPYAQSAIPWTPTFRTTLGLRTDSYWFHVRSDNPLNSGDAQSSILSPKLGLAFGPWANTAYFADIGTGFHSNDARGATITVDPTTLAPVQKVKPLVRATGAEFGVRTAAIPGLQTALTFWGLDLESELVFSGDAGSTEASRPSRRTGIEWTSTYALSQRMTFDGSVAYSRARFTDFDPVGDHIPGAVEGVIAAGLTVPDVHHFFGGLRVRYFGPRPLIEDNSVRSSAATVINAEFGHEWDGWLRASVEGFNLVNAAVSDIDYYYTSRLRGEPTTGVSDIHFHPEEPRTFRVRLSGVFGGPRSADSLPAQSGHPKGSGRE
jgi:hypothetical protein